MKGYSICKSKTANKVSCILLKKVDFRHNFRKNFLYKLWIAVSSSKFGGNKSSMHLIFTIAFTQYKKIFNWIPCFSNILSHICYGNLMFFNLIFFPIVWKTNEKCKKNSNKMECSLNKSKMVQRSKMKLSLSFYFSNLYSSSSWSSSVTNI